jgi:hypothetical protein
METVTPTPARSEELEIRLLNACAEVHLLQKEKDFLVGRLAAKTMEIENLHRAERIRLEKKKAAWKFAGKMGFALLFACGCAASIAGCMVYGPWWTAIAPTVLFLGGLWAWLHWI